MANVDSPSIFLAKNISKIQVLLNEVREVCEDFNVPIKSEDSFFFLNILNDICKNQNLLEEYFRPIETQQNTQDITTIKNLIISFLTEEKDNLMKYVKELNLKRKKNYLYLLKMDYKFIGLSSGNELDKGVITPKILVKLYFNDGSEKLLETNFASFKKLQEEIEECLSGFKSAYLRRIQHFSK